MKFDYNDRQFDWMRSKDADEIRLNCLLAEEGSLDPATFTIAVCQECERLECEWHPETMADRDSPEDVLDTMFPNGGQEDGYDPDGRVNAD